MKVTTSQMKQTICHRFTNMQNGLVSFQCKTKMNWSLIIPVFMIVFKNLNYIDKIIDQILHHIGKSTSIHMSQNTQTKTGNGRKLIFL